MPLGWIALAVGVIGAGAQAEEQRRATSQQKKADEIDARKAQIQNQRERRKAVAEARQKRAAIVAQSEASGTSGSSGAAGATGALTSKTAGTVGFQQSLEAMDAARFNKLSQANTSMSRAATSGAISQIGFSAAPVGFEMGKGTSIKTGTGSTTPKNTTNNPYGGMSNNTPDLDF